MTVTNNDVFPHKFCKHRWVENIPVVNRVLGLLPHLRSYGAAVKSKQVPDPKTKSYKHIVSNLKDPLLEAKLNIFLTLSSHVNPFLTLYQTDRPLIPFLASNVFKLIFMVYFLISLTTLRAYAVQSILEILGKCLGNVLEMS